MRNWSVALAMSALVALPLCAQQKSSGADESAKATADKVEKSAAATAKATSVAPAARNVFFRDVHQRAPLRLSLVSVAAAVGVVAPCFIFIWNGLLRTTPSTSAENLSPLRPASRAIARTSGMSW